MYILWSRIHTLCREMRFIDYSHIPCWSVLQVQGRTRHKDSGTQVRIIKIAVAHYATYIYVHNCIYHWQTHWIQRKVQQWQAQAIGFNSKWLPRSELTRSAFVLTYWLICSYLQAIPTFILLNQFTCSLVPKPQLSFLRVRRACATTCTT